MAKESNDLEEKFISFPIKNAEGHFLHVTVDDSRFMHILAVSLPENGLTVTVFDESGNIIKSIPLNYYSTVEAPASSVIVIPLGSGLTLAEIQW